jgi:ElaB/YqjD/DUF883 family membrane-anchored ribosome-binding protein
VASMTETVADRASAVRDGVNTMYSKTADVASQIGGTIADTSTELVESLTKAIKRNPLLAIGIAVAGVAVIGGAVMYFRRR